MGEGTADAVPTCRGRGEVTLATRLPRVSVFSGGVFAAALEVRGCERHDP